MLTGHPSLWVQVAAVLLPGLVAGLLFGYQCSVIRGLGALPDAAYLQAFQSINRSIQNPAFFAAFMGSVIVLPLAAGLCRQQGAAEAGRLLFLAGALYGLGVFGVTVLGNVPLNERLAQTDLTNATAAELARLRRAFEGPWNRLHTLRTVAAVLAFALACCALLKSNSSR